LWYHVHVPEERTTLHSHYNLNYHLVFTPKYRIRDWVVLGMEVMPDHVHLFLPVPPSYIESQRKYQDDDA